MEIRSLRHFVNLEILEMSVISSAGVQQMEDMLPKLSKLKRLILTAMTWPFDAQTTNNISRESREHA